MGEIVIDLSWVWVFLALPVDQMMLKMMTTVGWIPLAVVFLFGAKEIWMDYINGKWGDTQKYTLLAIDIPRGNEQSPKAVENIFTYLQGAHGTKNLIETYWEGQYQLSISLEIVSIDGYTQFLVYTPVSFVSLVESAFYSQYPNAEITEVNDYTEMVPHQFPDDQYDVWGTEFGFAKNYFYPIKTYEEFLHQMGKPEEQFKDPMATLMDLCSSLKKGEQLWWQNIITPLDFKWIDGGNKEIKSILGEKDPEKRNIADGIIDLFMSLLDSFSEMVYSLWADVEVKKEEKKDEALKMMNLKPIEKKKIEYISKKISKMGFEFKSRFVYIAKKEVMNRPKVVNGFVGFMKQFADLDLNNLKPEITATGTSAHYFFVARRLAAKKNKIVRNYVNRSSSAGKTPGIINIEELATIWHFPIEAVVKAPLIQKSSGRRAEPPATLPFSDETTGDEFKYSHIADENIFANLHDEVNGEHSNDDDEPKSVNIEKNNTAGSIFTDEEKKDISNKNEGADKNGTPPSNLPFV